MHRNGEDLTAVIPMEYFERVREILAQQDVERLAAALNWGRSKSLDPPHSWFDDEDDNPFEPEVEPGEPSAAALPTAAEDH